MPIFTVHYLRKLEFRNTLDIEAANERAARIKFLHAADDIEECWADATDVRVEIEEIAMSLREPLIGPAPTCAKCGSHNITRDASAMWDDNAKAWVLSDLQDAIYCEHCDEQV